MSLRVLWRLMALVWLRLLWALVLWGEEGMESWMVLPVQCPSAQMAVSRPYVASSLVMEIFRGESTSRGAARIRRGAMYPETCRAAASVKAVSLRLRWCRSSEKPCGKWVRPLREARVLGRLKAQEAPRRGFVVTVSVQTTGLIARCVAFVGSRGSSRVWRGRKGTWAHRGALAPVGLPAGSGVGVTRLVKARERKGRWALARRRQGGPYTMAPPRGRRGVRGRWEWA